MFTLFIDWLAFVAFHIIRLILDLLTILLSPILFLYYSYTNNKFFSRKHFETVLITGGSAGIGRAIGVEFIHRNKGKINLILTGRNTKRLTSTQTELSELISSYSPSSSSGKIITKQIDITDRPAMKKFIQTIDSQYNIDLLIANAGVSPHTPSIDNLHYFASSYPILETNCIGTLNTIFPIIPLLQERKKGHIAIVGSLSGYGPVPIVSSYPGTKSYLKFICDDLRPKLKLLYNIDVTHIVPGPVESLATTKEKFGNLPGFMSAKDSAKIVIDGLERNDNVIMYPRIGSGPMWIFGGFHPILMSVFSKFIVTREMAAQSIGFYHEFDPDDEFGGEC